MKGYLMSIVGAVLICVFTEIALPEKWGKYIKIITGLIIITTIASPLERTFKLNFDEYFDTPQEIRINAQDYTINMIKKELENTVANDIKQRMSDEFNEDISADVYVSLNEENKISGILKINLIGNVNDLMVNRINEIYAPEEVLVNGF